MEVKSPPSVMISMSRSARDYRAPKKRKADSELISNSSNVHPASKKSQIRGSGSPLRSNRVFKKAKDGVGSSAGTPPSSKKGKVGSDVGANGTQISRGPQRSKRGAVNSGDLLVDAFRPRKKLKITGEGSGNPAQAAGVSAKAAECGVHLPGKVLDAARVAYITPSTNITPKTVKGFGLVDDSTAIDNPKSAKVIFVPRDESNINNTPKPVKGVVPRDENPRNSGSHLVNDGAARITTVVVTPEAPTSSGVELTERQRALRPRRSAPAIDVVKRPRFRVVKLDEADGSRIVGRRIKVYWPLDKKWYYGQIKAFSTAKKLHKVVYDDHDEEWLKLQDEVFKLQMVSGEAQAASDANFLVEWRQGRDSGEGGASSAADKHSLDGVLQPRKKRGRKRRSDVGRKADETVVGPVHETTSKMPGDWSGDVGKMVDQAPTPVEIGGGIDMVVGRQLPSPAANLESEDLGGCIGLEEIFISVGSWKNGKAASGSDTPVTSDPPGVVLLPESEDLPDADSDRSVPEVLTDSLMLELRDANSGLSGIHGDASILEFPDACSGSPATQFQAAESRSGLWELPDPGSSSSSLQVRSDAAMVVDWDYFPTSKATTYFFDARSLHGDKLIRPAYTFSVRCLCIPQDACNYSAMYCRQLGSYYGSPCAESLFRVSVDYQRSLFTEARSSRSGVIGMSFLDSQKVEELSGISGTEPSFPDNDTGVLPGSAALDADVPISVDWSSLSTSDFPVIFDSLVGDTQPVYRISLGSLSVIPDVSNFSGILCKQIGSYYGPPCAESLFRVSLDFQKRLFEASRLRSELTYVSISSPGLKKEEELSELSQGNILVEDGDEELPDVEVADRVLVTSTEESVPGDSVGILEDQSNVEDEFEMAKQFSRSVAPLKKGRRSGKGKGFCFNTKSKEVWFDIGLSPIIDRAHDGLEPRKRRRKGSSPVHGDESDPNYRSLDMGVNFSSRIGHQSNIDAVSDQALPRSVDTDWSCTANVLIMMNDRCWRKVGAAVELQAGHGNSWMLCVSLDGESLYSHKAEQFVASGTTNKFTHAMMWRGSKAWSLEFMDRKQWQLFKEMHEECFQRNARAASVKHIPIPGVKQIQDCSKLHATRFVRPSKYIYQPEGELEMALASSRVMYDMDSEDEEWLSQANGENIVAGETRLWPTINEDMFESIVDQLEKNAFAAQADSISSDLAEELCQGYGSPEAIKIVHSYWSEKRERNGMALIRLYQPAPWEQYQKQLEDWQSTVNQLQQQSPTPSKQQLQSMCKRPPLFAFCLRPRGLEYRNKMQKQRSQRKQGLSSGSSSRPWTSWGHAPGNEFFLDSPAKRQAGGDASAGPLYGSRKHGRHRFLEENYSNTMAVDLTDSFDAVDTFTSPGGIGQVVPESHFAQNDSPSILRLEKASTGCYKARTKKLGRKARKMRLLAAAEESRRKRRLRAQQGPLKEKYLNMVHSPDIISDTSHLHNDISSSALTPHGDGAEEDDDPEALAAALAVTARDSREKATALRARAQALYAVADAAMHKAVSALIAADAIHATERAVDEAAIGLEQETSQLDVVDVPVAVGALKEDVSRVTPGGASFGSWRRALHSSSRNTNHPVSKGTSSKPVLLADTDDPLLPVASWSQELGAGLGTRLLQTGDVSPPRHRYSPVLEGLSKSPVQGVRGEGLVSLGRTRGESMMAMLTR